MESEVSKCPFSGGEAKFVKDFVAAWAKVMNADRFDKAVSDSYKI